MKQKSALIFFTFLCIYAAYGQSVDQRVFASAGQSVGQFAYTIGEPLINTLVAPNNTITQGFHQTKLIIVGIENVPNLASIVLYPNPSESFFSIYVSGYNQPLKMSIIDVLGKAIHEQVISNQDKIGVANLAQGTYFVVTKTTDNQLVSCHKFIKL